MTKISYTRATQFRTMTAEQTENWWEEGGALIPDGTTVAPEQRDAFEAFIRKMPIVVTLDDGHGGIEIRGLCPSTRRPNHYVQASLTYDGRFDDEVCMCDGDDAAEFESAQQRYVAMGLRSA